MEQESAKLYQQGQKQAAVKLLAQKLQQDMSHVEWFLQLSSYLTAGNDFTQAEELLLKAKQLFPHIQEIDYNLAVIYFEAGKPVTAQKILNNVTKANLIADAYFLMAKIKLQQQQLSQALVYALTVIDKNPASQAGYLLTGDIFLQLKDFHQAQNYYQKALLNKTSAPALFKLALVEMVLGKSQFTKHFQAAQRLDPQYFQDHQQQLSDIERYLKTQMKDDKK